MSDNISVVGWSASKRNLLVGILDEIIPASEDGRIPSAGSPNNTDFIASKAAQLPDFGRLLQEGLRTAQSLLYSQGAVFADPDPEGRLTLARELEQLQPEFFSALVRHTYMGYYADPAVPPLFGLSADPPHPYGYDVPDESSDELAALVDPVKSRGRCFEDC